METVGMRPVLVHGGGAAISRAMAEAGLEPRFVQGRRYTDDATLAIVERVLAGQINRGASCGRSSEFGGCAAALNFQNTNVLLRPAAQPARPATASHSTWAMWAR